MSSMCPAVVLVADTVDEIQLMRNWNWSQYTREIFCYRSILLRAHDLVTKELQFRYKDISESHVGLPLGDMCFSFVERVCLLC